MEFHEFRELQQKHVEKILKGQNTLFVTGVDKDLMWETYLNSFPPGTNEIHKENSIVLVVDISLKLSAMLLSLKIIN